jgi:AcrR family transcriptional regulator
MKIIAAITYKRIEFDSISTPLNPITYTTQNMKQSAAKQRILEVAQKMIKEKGYAAINVNDIAYQANVSIGTLYYHFPKGKSSILLETRKQIADDFAVELEKTLQKQKYLETSREFTEGLSTFLFVLLKLHRKDQQFLMAMEAEILANMKTYLEAVNGVDLDDLFLEEITTSIHPIKELIKRFPKENLTIEGNEKQVHKVIDILTHRHIYFGYNFGTDEEFIDMLTKIVYTLLKK